MTIDEIKRLDVDKLENFADFARDKLPMPGVKKRLDQVLGKTISILCRRRKKISAAVAGSRL